VEYKWFTKVLTGRLTKVAESIISKTQTTFMPGRNILEGVVILHETMHEMRKKKRKGIIMKLDFEKSYDKVKWSFLLEALERKRFHGKWIQWMKKAVGGGRVGINLNGEPG
jgi:transcription antitermination factor NusG